MKVRRVLSDDGQSYTHEPTFDPEWSGLTKLRWWCAIHRIDYPQFHLTAEVGGYTASARSYEQHYLLKLNGWMVEQGPAEYLIGVMWAALKVARMSRTLGRSEDGPTPLYDALETRYAMARSLNTVPFSKEQRAAMEREYNRETEDDLDPAGDGAEGALAPDRRVGGDEGGVGTAAEGAVLGGGPSGVRGGAEPESERRDGDADDGGDRA